ncbi:lysophospholipase L1-like esterase [Actinoplanes octamycinicus]|uniref:Lysophospholipase L1-like esterase n=1 Tax=Actinoplanes octamycinicus TaxID=135948 RepID=A0A7W7GUJ5_9ACTN|nr:SGNH/GDSL hydrolase family protein [Actinoplanes octamycinicus]MBB4738507.1 lysophospholipase L1-like esterase [Actinoplanes octamycinicus]GIE57628.1 SGNH hydrolase [Actinoplanes octamycinicus]
MSTRRQLLALTAGAAAAGALAESPAAAHPAREIASWAAVPTTVPPTAPLVLADQTVRHVVHLSVGGDQVRIRLTNEFGDTPLRIGEVHVRLGDADRRVTFGRRTSVTVPAGAPIVSDPVALRVPGGADLVISVYLPERTPVTTLAAFAFQDNVIAAGNVTAAPSVTPTSTIQQYLFLSGVSVRASGGAIVTLGDSITNGANTAPNANHRWPDLLSARLRHRLGVANVGVSGNRLLHDPNPPAGSPAVNYAAYFGQSALRRFDRDVLAQPGAEFLVVLLGVNDLGHPGTSAPLDEVVSADDLVWAHRQLIARAHRAGLRAYGATVLPFKDDTLGFYSVENERKRSALNRWIRTSGEYDAVIDFDAAVRDPADPLRLNPAYDSGDHLHPNDAGMAAMAAAVPLRLFKI